MIASAVVALFATLIAARTQVRLHKLQRTDQRLAELRDVIDESARAATRAKYRLADSQNINNEFEWDREFWTVLARLQVRLGADARLVDDYMSIWGALRDVKEAYSEDANLPEDQGVDLWDGVDVAMERFFENASVVVGPDPGAIEPDLGPLPFRQRVRVVRSRIAWTLRPIRRRRFERELDNLVRTVPGEQSDDEKD